MKKITFWEIQNYVGVWTKALRVPSTKRLWEAGVLPVAHSRTGRCSSIEIRRGDDLVFRTNRDAVYEEVTLFPGKGYLAGHDMSVMHREITVRYDDGASFAFVDDDMMLEIVADGVLIPRGIYVPEIKGWEERQVYGWMDRRTWKKTVLSDRFRRMRAEGGSEHKGFMALTLDGKKRWIRMEEARAWSGLEALMEDFSEVAVFRDGSVVYSSGSYDTVFALCTCNGYEYETVKETVTLPQDVLDSLPWQVRLSIKGADRIEKNNSNKKKEVPLWSGDTDSDIARYAFQEYFRTEQIHDAAWERLLSLDEEERKLLLLYYEEQMTQKELGILMEVRRETISRRINKLLKRMRENFK